MARPIWEPNAGATARTVLLEGPVLATALKVRAIAYAQRLQIATCHFEKNVLAIGQPKSHTLFRHISRGWS